MKTLDNRTIVAFHIGRGGRYYNPGFVTFIGEKKIGEFTENLFLNYENQFELFDRINGRPNLVKKYEECCDSNDFSFFERKGFKMGELVYTDCNGNKVGLSLKDVESGIGKINIDMDYDTTYTTYLDECSRNEMLAIEESDEWNKYYIIGEFFSSKGIDIDRKKFNGDYRGLIEEYFDFGANDLDKFFVRAEE